MSIISNSAIHLGVFLCLVIFGNFTGLDQLFLFTSLIITGVSSHIILRLARSRRQSAGSMLLFGITVFFFIAYTTKLVLALINVNEFWVAHRLIDPERLYAILPEAYFIACIGYISIMIGVVSFPLKFRFDWTVRPHLPRIKTLLIIASIGCAAKYYLKATFQLGVPGIEPISMGVPFLSGITTLAIRDGFLFLVNISIFLSLCGGNRGAIFLSIAIAFANAGIDLMFGSKNTILMQLVLIPIYLSILQKSLDLGQSKFINTSRLLLILMGLLGIIFVMVYKYLNFFRFALLLETSNIAQAVAIATANENAQSRSSIVELLNRFTGLETLGAVIHLREDFNVQHSFVAFFDGSVVRNFTQIVLDGVETRTMFSMTQFGYFYVLGGPIVMVLGSIFLGGMFAFLQYFTIKKIPVHHNMRLVFLPILWLSFVSVLLGGGNLILWVKGIVVTLALFFIFSRIAVRTQAGVKSDRAQLNARRLPL